MPGESVPQGLWLPPRVGTLFVAAYNALDRSLAQADYICDGVADDVQINAALAALPASGGRVVLSEGDFILADPVVFTDHEIVLEGQGWSTLINGDLLATGEHGIVISGFSNCQVKNLSIQTQDGGGNVCHCIFIEDGANDTLIENVYFLDSDSDAIHIEGTSINRVKIFKCFIEGADDYGMYIGMDAGDQSDNFHIKDNHIYSAGIDGIHIAVCNQNYHHIIEGNTIRSCVGHGMCLVEDVRECSILDNYIISNGGDGIRLETDCDNNLIKSNFCNSNTGFGIHIVNASCEDNVIENNKLIGNVAGAISDGGTRTILPEMRIPVPNPNTNIGQHPAELLTDGLAVISRFNVVIPMAFQELVRASIVLVPGGTGNLRRSVATDWGMVGSGESYINDSGAIAAGQVAVTLDHVELLDITAAFAGAAPIAQGDQVGVNFTRDAANALDTVNANCYLLELRLQYV
jgi:parallel beta-helix repeat protein